MTPRRRLTVMGIVWPLALAGAILAHRAGLLPHWVYEGRLRDEVLRRTGTDLADRSAPRPIVDVRRVAGEGGRYPTLVLDVRNVSDTTLRRLHVWSRFHLGTKDAGWSPTAEVAGTKAGPLAAGESRRIVLKSSTAQGLGVITRGPLLTADVYWTFSRVEDFRRARIAASLYAVPVSGE